MNVRIIKKNKKDDIQPVGVIDGQTSGQSQLKYEYHNNLTNEDRFKLDESFVDSYKNKKADFGFNGLGEMVFYRTYSRPLPDDPNRKESFCDTVKRVVEGCYEIQRRHSAKIHVPWDYKKAQASAQEMFERIWNFKFLPPGRGLWMMGTEFMWTRGSAALNNCGFVSTIDIDNEPAEPFCFLMDMSMLGVGVGFDTKGAGKLLIKLPDETANTGIYVIEDSREGWVQSLRILINAYTLHPERGLPTFDYSKIRKEDEPIKGFGGKAAGSGILKSLHNMFISHFKKVAGQSLNSVDIVDLMNYIGRCVVAGNVRRTAEIAFGEYDDEEYSSMKNCMKSLLPEDYSEFWAVTGKLYDAAAKSGKEVRACEADFTNAGSKIPTERLLPAISVFNKLNSHRWASNNSIFAKVGMDYTNVAQQIQVNGEPGLIYLDNVRDYGRMIDGKRPGIDGRVAGSNPCVEQSLESYELCNLVETFPANHKDAADYMRTLKFAYLYAKTVTLLPTHNARTNQVTLRNRRIGLSQSGIIQAFAKFGRRSVLRDFCDAGYNEIRRWDSIYSEWLCVTQSIKVTSVKPSGTVSLLVGATPGIHNPEARHYWRRVRIAKNNPLVKILADAGYHIEPVISDPDRTVVVKFAVSDSRVKPVNETTIWEQMANAIDYQRYWADNQVSCTVKFKSTEVDQIKQVLEAYEDQIKGISFLPVSDHGYAQAPYEPCTEAEVLEYNSKIKPADYSSYILEAVGSSYCDNDSCEMPKK